MDLESNNGVTEPSSSKGRCRRDFFKRRGHTYTYGWLMLISMANQHNIVKALPSIIKNKYYSLKAQCCFLPSLFYSLMPNFLQTFSLLVFMDYIYLKKEKHLNWIWHTDLLSSVNSCEHLKPLCPVIRKSIKKPTNLYSWNARRRKAKWNPASIQLQKQHDQCLVGHWQFKARSRVQAQSTEGPKAQGDFCVCHGIVYLDHLFMVLIVAANHWESYQKAKTEGFVWQCCSQIYT